MLPPKIGDIPPSPHDSIEEMPAMPAYRVTDYDEDDDCLDENSYKNARGRARQAVRLEIDR